MTTLILGAGIIGTTLARELQKRGEDVTLIDREAPGQGASFGNMASIAVTEFMPASRPSVWRQIPGWMLDPEGPVRIRPTYMPRLLPWFARFIAASRPSKLRALEAQGAALCARSLEDWQALLQETGLSDHLSAEGCLSLYADAAEFHADRDHVEILERFGIPHDRLTGAELRDLEPEIAPGIGLALRFPKNRSVKDPYKLVLELAQRFQSLGGKIQRGEVAAIAPGAVTLTDGRRLVAQKIVIALGAHSARLAKSLGEPIPLETERGYHTQVMDPGIRLRHSIIWPARAFMVTPTAGGIRIGGTVEMAGLDTPPDYRRAKITVKRAQTALPRLQVRETSEWMGHRPAFPDTVPLMSASRHAGIYYSTGHGHLGLTYAATSALLMADLITGARPALDLAPFGIDRF